MSLGLLPLPHVHPKKPSATNTTLAPRRFIDIPCYPSIHVSTATCSTGDRDTEPSRTLTTRKTPDRLRSRFTIQEAVTSARSGAPPEARTQFQSARR